MNEDAGSGTGESHATRWVFNHRYEPKARLARFVSEQALDGTELRLRDAPIIRQRARKAADGDLLVAEKIYESLLGRGISAAWEEWEPRWIAQPVRHPAKVVYDRHADCLDLALLYASICQAARVPALLAIVSGHAFVLLAPGRFADQPSTDEDADASAFVWPPLRLDGADSGTGAEEGVHFVKDLGPLLTAIEQGTFRAIDPYAVVYGSSFAQAVESGNSELRQPALRILDVPWLHSRPDCAPVAAPARAIQMSPYIPGGDDLYEDYPAREQFAAEVAGMTGVIVLRGESGTGKSMLARHLAATAPHGCGWFLNASEAESLTSSLAYAHLAGRERLPGGADEKNREEQAQAALAALRVAPHPWIVVLDNADGDPGPLRRLTPTPEPERQQLVIITSVNEQWYEQPDVRVIELEPLPEREIAGTIGHKRLVELAEGRPLLADAFVRLLRVAGAQEIEDAINNVTAQVIEGELLGPAVVWDAIEHSTSFTTEQRWLAVLMALLPPDHQPLGVLEAIDNSARQAVGELSRWGLVTVDEHSGEAHIARLHRLFGEAIRRTLSDTGSRSARAAAIGITSEEATMRLVEQHGDMRITTRLLEVIAPAGNGLEDPGPEAASGLHSLGRVLELQGDSLASARAYELAEAHLHEPLLIADCLQGRARAVNQREPKALGRVQEAIRWSKSAQELIEAHASNDAAGRTVAMRGLLLQKLAAFESYAEQRSELLDEARALIEDAHQRRLRYLEPEDPELLRSLFNFGGIEINLAKQHPDAAAEHLDRAEETYREVADRRRRTYGVDVHPHIAACHSGLVLVGFYRSTLLGRSDMTRSGWLRDATDNGVTAIHQREVLEGPSDGAEIRKVAERLTKAALARSVRMGHEREDAEKLFAEILSELPAHENPDA